MILHYLKVAFLHFRRDAFSVLMNVLVLATGLTCFLFALAVNGFWARAEQGIADTAHTYAITSSWQLRDGSRLGSGDRWTTNPWVADYLRTDFPELEAIARVEVIDESIPVRAGDKTTRARVLIADAELLDILHLPFTSGDAASALAGSQGVVLSAELAQTLYGTEAISGLPIRIAGRFDTTVSGILDEVPEPSHLGQSISSSLQFDLIVSRALFARASAAAGGNSRDTPNEDWYGSGTTTYVLLPEDGSFDIERLRAEIPAFLERHVPPPQKARANIQIGFVPIADLLKNSVDESLFLRRSELSISTLLLSVATLVLIVACLNFGNLSTALAAHRGHEVALRKVVGAKSRQLILQHLLESLMIVLVAAIVAILAVWLISPMVTSSTGIDMRLSLVSDMRAWYWLTGTVLITTLLAGAYPAFVLARVRPIAGLRLGQMRLGTLRIARCLVGAQVLVTSFLLITLTVLLAQNHSLENAGSRFASDQLYVIVNTPEITGVDQTTLRQELLRLPSVTAATSMDSPPWSYGGGGLFPMASSPNASAVERTALVTLVGEDFFETFGIQLLAGRQFDPSRTEDTAAVGRRPTSTENVIISVRLARELGFATPDSAIGELVYVPNSDPVRPNRIIGVVEDAPLRIASTYGSRPALYLFYPEWDFHVVRLDENDLAGSVQAIDDLWSRLAPDIALTARFADDFFKDSYQILATLHRSLAALAIVSLVISSVGLVAMASLLTKRRQREIAIRKCLGGKTSQMIVLLARSLALPILVANVLAWPLAYVVARAYLDLFISAIRLPLWPFVTCLLFTLTLAWTIASGKTLNAARTKPARLLRQE